MMNAISAELDKVEPSRLVAMKEHLGDGGNNTSKAMSSSNSALNQFTTDLTEQAKAGKIDPVIGRDNEIRLMIDILLRRRQNNPILTGEAGVGKTAVIEGWRKNSGWDVPPALRDAAIKSLDLALLQAGRG